MIKKYIEKIVENNNPEDMEELSEMLEEVIYKLKDYNEKCYEKYKMKLYIMAYGKVLTEEMAEEIVEDMRPSGEHWNMETTSSVKNQYSIRDISDVDFYVVMNAKYNDNRDTVERFAETEEDRLDMYVSLTQDFILDPDAKEGKVFTYFIEIPKK